MNLSRKVASALSFAHLAGLGRSKAAKAAEDDDDKKDRDHEDVEDGVKKGKKAEDDAPEKKEDDKKEPESKAEDDDPDANASGDDLPSSDDGDEDDDGDKKGKKAKGARADAEDGDDKKDDEKAKAAALKERARCAAIFASPAAARNIKMAAELAFNTDLTSEQAVAVLQTAPAATANPNRAAGNPRIAGSGAAEVTGKQAIDSSWDRAFAQVNPKRR